MKESNLKKIWLVVWILLAVVGIFIFYMYYNVSKEPRLYFSVQGINFDNTDKITIGRNSNLSYDKLPCDYMTITKLPDGNFSWEINELYKDSLAYYKVGNENPNLKKIVSGDVINIGERNIDAGIVENIFNQCVANKHLVQKQQSVQYIMARNIIAKEFEDTSYLGRTDIKSFFYRKNPEDTLQFCILDSKCKICKANGSELGYCYAGTVSADKCKVQFFSVTENSYMIENPTKDVFIINDLCYTVKPIVMTTEWGAGHIRIVNDADGVRVFFPKSITMVERIDELKEGKIDSKAECKTVNVMQNIGAFPGSDVIYIPTFCGLYNMDVCSVNLVADGIYIKDNCGNSTKVESKSRFIPDLNSVNLKSSNVHLMNKVGFIDGNYVRSFVFLPLSVFFFLLLFFFILKHRIRNTPRVNNIIIAKKRNSYMLAICMFVIALYYGLCKTLIAIKLSYTYPYFEKMVGMNVVSVSLSLILVFTLYALFSQSRFRSIDDNHRRRIPTNVLPFIFSIIAMVFVGYNWHCIDNSFNANMLNSYISEDLFCFKFWEWSDLFGMNDTHRNVLYALSLVIIFAMFGMLLLFVKNRFIPHDNRIGIRNKWDKFIKGNKEKVILIAIGLIAIMLVFVWLLGSGNNYSTIFITLILVVGTSFVLTHLKYSKSGLLFMNIALLLLAIIGLSWLPDKGYITNWFGVIVAIVWIISLQIVEQNNNIDDSSTEKVPRYIMVVAVGSILLVSGYIYFYDIDNNKVNYDRKDRRFDLLLKFGDVKDKGFRYTESDVEFMLIMSHYMQNNNGEDPLSSESHWLHPSISTGQSPVILNDVSIQSSFFSSYGWVSKCVYFILLLILVIIVNTHVLFSSAESVRGARVGLVYKVKQVDIRRTLAVFMWVGTSLYLYLSYCGAFPFTGRLNPGFGVDAVGEALESALLMAFMMSDEK